MTTGDIIWRLAQLASLPFQERYVIGGTADEYVLDTELLENVDGIKYLIKALEHPPNLSEEQNLALEDLFSFIEARSGEALSGQSPENSALLIREGEVWQRLRGKAVLALVAFGYSSELSVEEIDQLCE